MGASPYWYFVNYEPDINLALQKLRRREFEAGRYNPVIPMLDFPLGPNPPSPGRQHESIEDAIEDSGEEGTGSILDIQSIGEVPDFCVAGPLSAEELEAVYGTAKPSREMVEANMEFLDGLERGMGVYIVVFAKGQPKEILFAGYSVD